MTTRQFLLEEIPLRATAEEALAIVDRNEALIRDALKDEKYQHERLLLTFMLNAGEAIRSTHRALQRARTIKKGKRC